MGHDLKQKPLDLSKHDNPEINRDQLKKVADKAFDSANLTIKAAGAAGQTLYGNLDGGITRKEDAVVELANSVSGLHDLNDLAVDGYAVLTGVIFSELDK